MFEQSFNQLLSSIHNNQIQQLNLITPAPQRETINVDPLQSWEGHTSSVWDLAVLHDGSVVSGSNDNTLRRWGPQSGQCLSIWNGHTYPVTALVVLPDGSVVSGSDDNTLRHWDTQSGQCLSTWIGHTDGARALAVLHDGSVVSGSKDNTLRHWDPQSGKCLSTWKGHTYPVTALAVLHDGSVVSASWDKTLRHWDTQSEKCLSTWKGHTNAVRALAVLPDGSVVSASDDETLRHWGSRSGQCPSTWKGHTSDVYALAVNTLRRWGSQSGKCLSTWKGHTKAVTALAILPDGSVVSASADNALRHWDPQSGKCLSTWKGHTKVVNALAVLPDGSVVSASWDKTLRHWDPQSGKCLSTWNGHTHCVTALAVLHNGSVVSGGVDGTLQCWPVPPKVLTLEQLEEVLMALKDNRSVQSLALSGVTFTPSITQALAQLIVKHPQLSSIALENCDLTDESVQPILHSLKNPASRVTQFTVSHNPGLSQEAQTALKQAIAARPANPDRIAEQQGSIAAQGAPANAEPVAPTLPLTPSPSPSVTPVTPAETQQSPPIVSPGTSVMDVTTGGIQVPFEIAPEELTYEMQLNPRTQAEEPVCLGQGGFGVVYKGTWRHQPVAVKALTSQGLTDSAREEFINEVQVMVNLRVPQVVALYGISVQPRYQLVMEYCPHGSLFGYLHSSQPMDWGMRGRIALEVAQGLAFLHACQPPILHRDLKSQNILLDKDYHAKLADFGLSRLKQESRSFTNSSQKDSVGTLAWMAPELFKRRARYVKGSDMYSYGMILWELSSRSIPWSDAHSNALIIQWVSQGDREDIPSSTPLSIATLIKACWEADPEKRPSAEEAMKTLAQSLGGLEQMSASGSDLGQGTYQGAFASAGASATPAAGTPSVANPAVPSYISGYQGLGSHTASGGGYAGQSGTFFSQGGSGTPSSPTSGYQEAGAYSGYQSGYGQQPR